MTNTAGGTDVHWVPVSLEDLCQRLRRVQVRAVGANFPAVLLADIEFSDLSSILDQESSLNECFVYNVHYIGGIPSGNLGLKTAPLRARS